MRTEVSNDEELDLGLERIEIVVAVGNLVSER